MDKSAYIIRYIVRRLPGKVINLIPKPSPVCHEGCGSCSQVGDICMRRGIFRVLLVTDRTLAGLGFHKAVCDSLDKSGICYDIFCDIDSEPDLQIIKSGIRTASSTDTQGIIALGGGSVMDASKMIASGIRLSRLPAWALLVKFLFVPGGTVPLITIPTTAGTGAEATVGAVISGRKAKKSTVIVGLKVSDVILDSSLLLEAPSRMLAACGIDALSHGLEGVVADIRSSDEDVRKSMGCVRLVLENLPVLIRTSDDRSGQADLLQSMLRAAHYGGNAINMQLAGYVHAFAHAIGSRYHIAHGRAIAMCLLPVMRFQCDHSVMCEARLAKCAQYCGMSSSEELLDAVKSLVVGCSFEKVRGILPQEDYKSLTRMIALDSINYSPPMAFTTMRIHQLLDIIRRDNGD